jgi:hypothetical protein
MLSLALSLPSMSSRRVGGGGVVYTNTAFVSTTGDDGTGELNNPDLPFLTWATALLALFVEYGNAELTTRVLDDGWDATVDLDNIPGFTFDFTEYIILRGHGGAKEVTGTIDASGADGNPMGFSGLDIVLWDIELSAYDGTGGDSTSGTDGDGGNGGNVYLIADALVTTFTSPGGAPSGEGAAGADGKERTVILLPNGEPQRLPNGTFDTYPVP